MYQGKMCMPLNRELKCLLKEVSRDVTLNLNIEGYNWVEGDLRSVGIDIFI